ncbi:MAG: hypothetical protein HRU09_00160 [Oligoflexales bacterium]|nr:hypothetical protein [Oligoflexales bacterium]
MHFFVPLLLLFFYSYDGYAESSRFKLNANGSELKAKWTNEPIAIDSIESDKTSPIRVHAYGKVTKISELVMWVELVLENKLQNPIENVNLELTNSSSRYVFDYSVNAHNDKKLKIPYKKEVGGLAAYGLAKVIVALPFKPGDLKSEFKLEYELGQNGLEKRVQRSSPLVKSEASARVWFVNTDNDEVVVVDSEQDQIIKRIPTSKEPSSISISYDEKLIAVASAKGNEVIIIDQEAMKIIGTYGSQEQYGRELTSIVFAPDSYDVYVSSYVEGLVSKLDLDATGLLISETTLAVGPRPSGLTIHPNGNRLYISHFLPRGDVKNNEAWISKLSLDTFSKVNETIIEDHFNPGRDNLKCLANFYSSNPVTRLALGKTEPDDLSFEGVASQISGVFLDPSGQKAWVAGSRVTGAIVVLEKGQDADSSLKRFGGLQPGQYVPAVIFMHDVDQNGNLQTMYTNDREMAIPTAKKILGCMHHPFEIEFIPRKVIDAGKKEQTNIFLAYGIPQAGMSDIGVIKSIAFTKGGRRALLVSPSSDEIAVYDGATQNPITQKHHLLTGSNPKDILVGPDGNKLYVLYENSDFLSVIDISAYNQEQLPEPFYVPYYYHVTRTDLLQLGAVQGLPLIRRFGGMPEYPSMHEVKKIPFKKDPLTKQMRRGKVLFESANPDKYPVSMSRLGACISCHPGGGSDGSSWVTMEGPRRTMSLRGGVAKRGFLHASATHENAYEFVQQVVAERLGGSLDQKDKLALAEYVNNGIPTIQNPRVDEDSRVRGEQLFKARCAGCHAGEAYTSGARGEFGVYDIGTKSDYHGVSAGGFFTKLLRAGQDKASAEILDLLQGDRDLGPGDPLQEILGFRQRPARDASKFKAPSLVGAFDHAIFFHDGSLSSLKGAIEKINELKGYGLSDAEISDLETYIKTL